jgi:hypothetical protein
LRDLDFYNSHFVIFLNTYLVTTNRLRTACELLDAARESARRFPGSVQKVI